MKLGEIHILYFSALFWLLLQQPTEPAKVSLPFLLFLLHILLMAFSFLCWTSYPFKGVLGVTWGFWGDAYMDPNKVEVSDCGFELTQLVYSPVFL